MIARRDLIFGAMAVSAGAASYALKPRKVVSLLQSQKLSDLIPLSFGNWVARDVSDPLALNSEDSLAAKLYNQIITRVYSDTVTGADVIMLMAHGERQTDALQLHRPEVCYPAFGYALTRNEGFTLPVGDGVSIPARRLVARLDGRQENVIYWTRLGEYLPASASQQRRDRFEIALKGLVPDGLLSRFSTVGFEPTTGWAEIERFVSGLVLAVAAKKRAVLIGSERARMLSRLA